MSIDWLGVRYPSWDDLVSMAEDLAIPVVEDIAPRPVFVGADNGGPLILIPQGLSPLHRMWALAHELGHAVRHSGPLPLARGKQEAQANHWAACALIPESRVHLHQNASLDTFIGALSAHYEEIPYQDCALRKLAARVAKYRLQALEKSLRG